MSCHCGRTAIAARAGIHNHGPWLWIPGSRASPAPRNDSVVSPLSGAEPIETFLLLVAERCVKLLERRLHGLHRPQHGVEALLHRLQAANRRERPVGLALPAQQIGSVSRGVL